MDTYITKEIALDAISYAETLSEAFRLIMNQKAADVVAVVRCRECIHWSDKWEAASIPEAHYCRKMGLFKLPSYYCADGEHMAGGQHE